MTLCPDDELTRLLEGMAQPSGPTLEGLKGAVSAYPDDPRLHFLLGSVLIGEGQLIDAHEHLARAIEIEPEYHLARFQLGFFSLTSGEPERALDVWGRLDRLPDDHYLRKFVDGLRCLIRDDFNGAIASLSEGIQLNQENLPMNSDMQLLIEECHKLLGGQTADDAPSETSATSLLLNQLSGRGPGH
ncbi:tetratricopeptide repeat protein [Maricaulis sp. D1M11]|uniref:tetratricopeptide repeat protein n=1 Tax=Maricaulis sp. D1M11 TaxID=3076117 RepID=UPI0039B6682D